MEADTTAARKPGEALDPAVSVVLGLYEAIDSGRATAALELFTPDAVFEGPGGVLEGTGEISAFLTARERRTERRTVHVLTNVVARRLDERDIEVRGVMMIHTPDAAGDWHMERLLRVRHVVRTVEGTVLIVARRREPLERPTPTAAG